MTVEAAVGRDGEVVNLIVALVGLGEKTLEERQAALVGATRVTRADTVIGTAAYLSPEQARGMPAAPAR